MTGPDRGYDAARIRPNHSSRRNAATARMTVRRHWLFVLLFTLGVLLRVMAQVAYQRRSSTSTRRAISTAAISSILSDRTRWGTCWPCASCWERSMT